MPDKKEIDRTDFPFSPEAEKNVIGILLLDKTNQDYIFSELPNSNYFFMFQHQKMYESLQNIAFRKESIEVTSLVNELRALNLLEKIGGVKYIWECVESVVAVTALKTYIKILQDNYSLRRLLTAVRTIDLEFKDNPISDIPSFITESEIMFKESINDRRVGDFEHSSKVGERLMNSIDKRIKNADGREIEGLSTGYKRLDKITGGLKKGEVTILAARPNLGKTSLALNIARNCAQFNNVAVAVFSLEMLKDKIHTRLLSAESGIEGQKFNVGTIDQYQRQQAVDAMRVLSSLDIYYDDTARIELHELVTKSNKLYNQLANEGKELGLIVVDYIGLIRVASKGKGPTNVQEDMRLISSEMKALANDLRVPILLLSQLNRKTEERGGRPQMSDLRDSGNLEQDADVVILLHRDDYQRDSKKDPTKDIGSKKPSQLTLNERMEYIQSKGVLGEKYSENTSVVEVIVSKNRNGGTGSTYLMFHRNTAKYVDMSSDLVEKILNFTADFAD